MAKNVYIDGRLLVPRTQSGVAHYLSSLLRAYDNLLDEPEYSRENIHVFLLVPFRAKKLIASDFNFKNIRIKSIFLPTRAINLLVRKKLFPPIDLFAGKGTFIFPGFVTMPVTPASRSIVFIYDMVYKVFPESLDSKMLSLLSSHMHNSVKADRIITISNAVADEIISVFPEASNKIEVITPSVDTRHFYRRSNDEIASVKNNPYLNISGAYILAVGNLEPRKNILSLVEAYALLPQATQKRYSLVIVGASSWQSSETMDKIQDYIHQGYKIKVLIGQIGDETLPALYSGASLFIFPSLYEGYGMPILEAMATGIPVIAGSSAAMREASGGVGIHITDITKPKIIAQKISQTLQNIPTQEKLMKDGYARIDQLPSWRDGAITLTYVVGSLTIEKEDTE